MAVQDKHSKTIKCKCNKCGETVDVPTATFYAERRKAYYVDKQYHPAEKLTHSCGGTYSTLPSSSKTRNSTKGGVNAVPIKKEKK